MSRSRKQSAPARSRQPGTYRSVASQMTKQHERAVEEAAAAELAGDALTALERHRRVPMFKESDHGDFLAVLAEMGDDVPDWLLARWMTTQAVRAMWRGGDESRLRRALQSAVPAMYPAGVRMDKVGCRWPEQVMPYLANRDWVVRQLVVHQRGGLADVVTRVSPDLLDRAGQVSAWADAPMGGYRFEGTAGAVTRLVDAASGTVHEVLDLGLGVELDEGDHVLARLVPTSVTPGLVTEWRPLLVNQATARRVAAHPDRWFIVLAAQLRTGQLPSHASLQDETAPWGDHGLRAWTRIVDPRRPPDPSHELRAEVLQQVLDRAELDPASLLDTAHEAAAALLDGPVASGATAPLVAPARARAWRILAGIVPPVGRARCRTVAELAEPRAAS